VLLTKFQLILAKHFQRRRFLEIDQSKTRIACGMFVNGSRRNASYQAVSEEKLF
jgi:hypothetical protein